MMLRIIWDIRPVLLISLAIIPCLFIGNRLVPRRDLMEEQLSEVPDRSIRRQVVPLFFLWILFTGPRLLDLSLPTFFELFEVF